MDSLWKDNPHWERRYLSLLSLCKIESRIKPDIHKERKRRRLKGRTIRAMHIAYRGHLVKLVLHQILVDKIENLCYLINRCTFDMVLPSILSTQYWESLIFSPCIVIGEIEHFCVPRGQRRFFIKIEAKASICS